MIREKHLYNVTDIHMHWQDAGDYLCVKMTRAKTKKSFTTNFEIFCMREPAIPIEQLEVSDPPIAFGWEPRSNRFAIVHGSNASKSDVSFYALTNRSLKAIKTFPGRACNNIYWAPAGGNCVLAGLGTLNGVLEFIDVTDGISTAVSEHFQCTDVEWDPSGRYVLTAVCRPLHSGPDAWKYGMDSGYKIWNMHGQCLQTVPVESLYQAMWRPRPPTLLSKDHVANIKKQLKAKYWGQFTAEDEQARVVVATGQSQNRNNLRKKWNDYRASREKEYGEERAEREQLRGGEKSDDEEEWEDVEQTIEEEVDAEDIPV